MGDKVETGYYVITFNEAFNSPPDVIGTTFTFEGSWPVTFQIEQISERQFKARIANYNGACFDFKFSFIAIGIGDD